MFRMVCAFALVASAAEAGDSPRQAFVRAWEGQTVVVTRTLYTLVYDERGKLGNTYNGRYEGLTIVTPTSTNVAFHFAGRQGRRDVVTERPEEIVNAVRTEYAPDTLELRSYQKVEPVVVYRYDPGVELVVSTIRVERDTVRVGFAAPARPENEVTSLTVRWPTPFSKAFTEHDIVEALIRGFVDRKSLP